MPLGLMPGMAYEEKEMMLAPGDTVLLHSDGIVEAHSLAREMFGFPGLKRTVADGPPGAKMIDRVLADVAAFTGPDAEQEDDITMVTLHRTGAAPDPEDELLTAFEIASAPGNERDAMDRVRAAAAGLGLQGARLDRLGTAVAEATMNAMEHGNEYRADRVVSIRVLRHADRLVVQFADYGDAGEDVAAETPDIEAKLDGRQRPRGWGLFLIEKMVDETRETNIGGRRTLELTVGLPGGTDDDA
jgi:anti-sigma regulatory factor (Ser/Thr protein kinase)